LASVAIVTKGDVKKGLLRLRNWKKVCEQYDFKNVGEKHGTQWIKDHANSLVFSVGQDKNGCNGYGVNLGSFLPSVLKTDYEMQCYLRAVADNMRHNTPTLAHVRRGSFFFVELKGYGWRNFSMTLDKKVTSVYQDAYPIKVKKILIVNPPALSLFVAIKEICKVFVKKKTIDRVAPVSPEGLSQYFEHDQIPAYLGGGYAQDFWQKRDENLKIHRASVAEMESGSGPRAATVSM